MRAGLGFTPRTAPLDCLRRRAHPRLCGGWVLGMVQQPSAARSTRWAGPAACWAGPAPRPPHGCVKGRRRAARQNHRQRQQARASSSGSRLLPAASWRLGRPNLTLSVDICALCNMQRCCRHRRCAAPRGRRRPTRHIGAPGRFTQICMLWHICMACPGLPCRLGSLITRAPREVDRPGAASTDLVPGVAVGGQWRSSRPTWELCSCGLRHC